MTKSTLRWEPKTHQVVPKFSAGDFEGIMDTAPDATGPINIGDSREFTIRELAELIIELTGTKS
jgi:hypothetical protein